MVAINYRKFALDRNFGALDRDDDNSGDKNNRKSDKETKSSSAHFRKDIIINISPINIFRSRGSIKFQIFSHKVFFFREKTFHPIK